MPSFPAGAPAQRWPVGICPTTAEPGATSARFPTRAGEEDAAGADHRARADLDRADLQVVPVEPVAGEVHLGLHGAAAAEFEHARDRGQGVQVHLGADLGAEGSTVAFQPRAGEGGGADAFGEPFGRPEPQVDAAAARVASGADAAQQEAGAAGGDREAAGRAEEQQGSGGDEPPRGGGRPWEGPEVVQDVAQGQQGDRPAQADQGEQGDQQQRLGDLGAQRDRCDGAGLAVALGGLLQVAGELAQGGLLVDVEDGGARVAGA